MRYPTKLRNERGVVLDWLLKVGVWIAIFGLLLFEGGAIMVNRISLDGTANDMAIQLATQIGSGEALRPDQITDAAEVAADEAGVELVKAVLGEDGLLRVRIRRTADTILVGKIGAIEDWAVATATGKSDVR